MCTSNARGCCPANPRSVHTCRALAVAELRVAVADAIAVVPALQAASRRRLQVHDMGSGFSCNYLAVIV